MEYMLWGLGSNLLVSDQGYQGVAIRLSGELAQINQQGSRIIAGGGAKLANLVNLSGQLELSGLEWAAAIPATLGGALFMNAGSFGFSIASVASKIILLGENLEIVELEGAEMPVVGYRNGGISPGMVVLSANIDLHKDSQVQEKIYNNLQVKKEKFPLDFPNAGSVFKNPVGDYAGRLIEEAGLKGYKHGQAQISTKHANFIVNLGGAKADDIIEIIRFVKAKVKRLYGVELQTEVKMVGYV